MATLTNKVTVNYKLKNVNFLTDSNNSLFEILEPALTIVKSNLPIAGIVGDVVSFTIVITNTNLLSPVTNVIVTDNLLVHGYTYVAETAKINGVATTDLPSTGISVRTIAPLAVVTIIFNATVN